MHNTELRQIIRDYAQLINTSQRKNDERKEVYHIITELLSYWIEGKENLLTITDRNVGVSSLMRYLAVGAAAQNPNTKILFLSDAPNLLFSFQAPLDVIGVFNVDISSHGGVNTILFKNESIIIHPTTEDFFDMQFDYVFCDGLNERLFDFLSKFKYPTIKSFTNLPSSNVKSCKKIKNLVYKSRLGLAPFKPVFMPWFEAVDFGTEITFVGREEPIVEKAIANKAFYWVDLMADGFVPISDNHSIKENQCFKFLINN